MKLSDQLMDQFVRDGYLFFPGLFSDEGARPVTERSRDALLPAWPRSRSRTNRQRRAQGRIRRGRSRRGVPTAPVPSDSCSRPPSNCSGPKPTSTRPASISIPASRAGVGAGTKTSTSGTAKTVCKDRTRCLVGVYLDDGKRLQRSTNGHPRISQTRSYLCSRPNGDR